MNNNINKTDKTGTSFRNWAKLNRNVIFGKSDGKIIWQPRIGCWYDDRIFFNKALPEPYTGLSLFDLYRKLDCSARLYEYNVCFERVEDSRVKIIENKDSNNNLERIIETPVGIQREVWHYSPNNLHPVQAKFEVETQQELKAAIWREENVSWRWNQQAFEDMQKKASDLGAPCMFMPRSNVQSLYLEKMGIERGVYALYDWKDLVEAYFAALDISHDKLMDVINDCPIEIINLGENIHSGTMSPKLFKQYHLPTCQKRCEKLHLANKFVCSHWDGNCKGLLQYAKETGMDGIEAITPLPQGDVTLEEMKDALGDELFLLDGIPAVYFDDTYSLDVLEDCTRQVIELFAPKLVLGASDEISSTADISRIPFVGQIVDEYNASCIKRHADIKKDDNVVGLKETAE